jgi:hypothetical protein
VVIVIPLTSEENKNTLAIDKNPAKAGFFLLLFYINLNGVGSAIPVF